METKTIGQTIGVSVDTFSVTNDNGDKVTIRIKFDYNGASNADIISWLDGNRRIAFQRPLRALSVMELKALDGTTVNVNDCGKKVKSREERIQAYVSVGIPRNLAEIAIDNPAAFATAMKDVEVPGVE